MYSDSLVLGIQKALKLNNCSYPTWYISGASGLGARFSLSMNVKSGREIGHPSSNYIWDIISAAHYCFSELGIKWRLFIDQAYNNRARKTAAINNVDTSIMDNVVFIDDYNQVQDEGNYIYANSDGEWNFYQGRLSNIHVDRFNMPFGIVCLEVIGVLNEFIAYQFPKSMLSYLIQTLERGEEPMEISGKGNYSAVSGWKAYARWMQGFSMPLKGIMHQYLPSVIELLSVRRYENSLYWDNISKMLSKRVEINFAVKLHEIYTRVANKLSEMVKNQKWTYVDVRELYYLEQETLPVYKKIDKYLHSLKL